QVKDNFVRAERKRLLNELAKRLADRVNTGEPMTALEAEAKNKVEKTEPFTRKTIPQSISEAMVAQAFALPKGRAGYGDSPDHTTDIVFRVADVIPAASPTLTETDTLNRELQSQLAEQSLGEYAEALKKKYGISVNE